MHSTGSSLDVREALGEPRAASRVGSAAVVSRGLCKIIMHSFFSRVQVIRPELMPTAATPRCSKSRTRTPHGEPDRLDERSSLGVSEFGHLLGVGSEVEVVAPERDQALLVDVEESGDRHFEPALADLEPVNSLVRDAVSLLDL